MVALERERGPPGADDHLGDAHAETRVEFHDGKRKRARRRLALRLKRHRDLIHAIAMRDGVREELGFLKHELGLGGSQTLLLDDLLDRVQELRLARQRSARRRRRRRRLLLDHLAQVLGDGGVHFLLDGGFRRGDVLDDSIQLLRQHFHLRRGDVLGRHLAVLREKAVLREARVNGGVDGGDDVDGFILRFVRLLRRERVLDHLLLLLREKHALALVVVLLREPQAQAVALELGAAARLRDPLAARGVALVKHPVVVALLPEREVPRLAGGHLGHAPGQTDVIAEPVLDRDVRGGGGEGVLRVRRRRGGRRHLRHLRRVVQRLLRRLGEGLHSRGAARLARLLVRTVLRGAVVRRGLVLVAEAHGVRGDVVAGLAGDVSRVADVKRALFLGAVGQTLVSRDARPDNHARLQTRQVLVRSLLGIVVAAVVRRRALALTHLEVAHGVHERRRFLAAGARRVRALRAEESPEIGSAALVLELVRAILLGQARARFLVRRVVRRVHRTLLVQRVEPSAAEVGDDVVVAIEKLAVLGEVRGVRRMRAPRGFRGSRADPRGVTRRGTRFRERARRGGLLGDFRRRARRPERSLDGERGDVLLGRVEVLRAPLVAPLALADARQVHVRVARQGRDVVVDRVEHRLLHRVHHALVGGELAREHPLGQPHAQLVPQIHQTRLGLAECRSIAGVGIRGDARDAQRRERGDHQRSGRPRANAHGARRVRTHPSREQGRRGRV